MSAQIWIKNNRLRFHVDGETWEYVPTTPDEQGSYNPRQIKVVGTSFKYTGEDGNIYSAPTDIVNANSDLSPRQLIVADKLIQISGESGEHVNLHADSPHSDTPYTDFSDFSDHSDFGDHANWFGDFDDYLDLFSDFSNFRDFSDFSNFNDYSDYFGDFDNFDNWWQDYGWFSYPPTSDSPSEQDDSDEQQSPIISDDDSVMVQSDGDATGLPVNDGSHAQDRPLSHQDTPHADTPHSDQPQRV